MPRNPLPLALFVVFTLGMGLLIGWAFPTGPWYDTLQKPWFNPPGWLFGPVWSVLYVLIGITGWRVFCRLDRSELRLLWVLQMLLNFAWSPIFFGARMIGGALAIIVVLLAVILCFIAIARRVEPPSAWMFVPYALWVGFATLLNGAIFLLN